MVRDQPALVRKERWNKSYTGYKLKHIQFEEGVWNFGVALKANARARGKKATRSCRPTRARARTSAVRDDELFAAAAGVRRAKPRRGVFGRVEHDAAQCAESRAGALDVGVRERRLPTQLQGLHGRGNDGQ